MSLNHLLNDTNIDIKALSITSVKSNISGTQVSAETLTAGTNVILAAGILSGIQQITGAATTDTGTNIDTKFPNLVSGNVVKCLVLNDVNSASAITAGVGVTLGVTNFAIPANASRLLYFKKTGTATYNVY